MSSGLQVPVQMISAFVYLVAIVTEVSPDTVYCVDMSPQIFGITETEMTLSTAVPMRLALIVCDFVVAVNLSASPIPPHGQCERLPQARLVFPCLATLIANEAVQVHDRGQSFCPMLQLTTSVTDASCDIRARVVLEQVSYGLD